MQSPQKAPLCRFKFIFRFHSRGVHGAYPQSAGSLYGAIRVPIFPAEALVPAMLPPCQPALRSVLGAPFKKKLDKGRGTH